MSSLSGFYVGGAFTLLSIFGFLVGINFLLVYAQYLLKVRGDNVSRLNVITIRFRVFTLLYTVIAISVAIADIITH